MLRIHANVQGMDPDAEIRFERHVLLLGPSGSGKSRVQKALELALSQQVTDIAGRAIVKDSSMIYELLAPDEGELFAEVTDETGRRWRWGKLNAKEPVWTGPGGMRAIFPILDARTAFGGDANRAQRYVLAQCGVTRAAILERLEAEKPGLSDAYEKLAQALFVGEEDEVVVCTKMQDALNKQARELAKEMKGAKAVLTAISGEVPTDHEILTARGRVERLRIDSGEAMKRVEVLGRARRTNDIAAQLDRDIASAAKLADEETGASTAPPLDRELLQNSIYVFRRAAARWTAGLAECKVCGSKLVDPKAAAASAASRADRLEAQLRAPVKPAGQHARRLAQLQLQRANLGVLPEMPDEDDAESAAAAALTAENDLKAAEERLITLRAAQKSAEANASAKALIASNEAKIALRTQIAATLKAYVETCTRDGMATWNTSVAAWMPRGLRFGAKLAPARYGLIKGRSFRPAVSGGETVALQIAMALAACPLDLAQLPILIPQDAMVDAKLLAKIMAATSRVTYGHIVLASTIPPAGRLPANWQIIECTEEAE